VYTETEISEFLMSLDVTKVSGPDGNSARMLKDTAMHISLSLTRMTNREQQVLISHHWCYLWVIASHLWSSPRIGTRATFVSYIPRWSHINSTL